MTEKMNQYTQRVKIENYYYYCLSIMEIDSFAQSNLYDAICDAFDYGLAKGYRAAQAAQRRKAAAK